MHGTFQIAFQTDLPAFVWAVSQPSNMVEDFQLWMTASKGDGTVSWLDAFDLTKHCNGSGPDDVVFVDIAGGVGHQCALLKAKLPQIQGRVILEDLPIVIPQAIPTPGVESMGIDMWQEQPIKGLLADFNFVKHIIMTDCCLLCRSQNVLYAKDSPRLSR